MRLLNAVLDLPGYTSQGKWEKSGNNGWYREKVCTLKYLECWWKQFQKAPIVMQYSFWKNNVWPGKLLVIWNSSINWQLIGNVQHQKMTIYHTQLCKMGCWSLLFTWCSFLEVNITQVKFIEITTQSIVHTKEWAWIKLP